jgi:hypothetical protein
MKLTVGIYKSDEKGTSIRAGELHYDGKTITTKPARPDLRQMLKNIATTLLMWPGLDEPIDPKKEPERFMKNLWMGYRSPYCQALKATVE